MLAKRLRGQGRRSVRNGRLQGAGDCHRLVPVQGPHALQESLVVRLPPAHEQYPAAIHHSRLRAGRRGMLDNRALVVDRTDQRPQQALEHLGIPEVSAAVIHRLADTHEPRPVRQRQASQAPRLNLWRTSRAHADPLGNVVLLHLHRDTDQRMIDQLAVVLPAQAPETPDEFHRLPVRGEAFPLLEQVTVERLGGCDLGPAGGERLPHGHDPLLGGGHQRRVKVRLVRIRSIRSCPDLRPHMGADRGAVAQKRPLVLQELLAAGGNPGSQPSARPPRQETGLHQAPQADRCHAAGKGHTA